MILILWEKTKAKVDIIHRTHINKKISNFKFQFFNFCSKQMMPLGRFGYP